MRRAMWRGEQHETLHTRCDALQRRRRRRERRDPHEKHRVDTVQACIERVGRGEIAAPFSRIAGVAQGAPPDTPVAPKEIATPGRPQGTEKFGASVDTVPIIDAHIHLFDGTRPQGASYMGSAKYIAQSKTSLPGLYEPLARPSGIVGAIIVESSAWVDA